MSSRLLPCNGEGGLEGKEMMGQTWKGNAGILMVAMLVIGLAAGCATIAQQGSGSTAAPYPTAVEQQEEGSDAYGHPFRLVGFVLHPAGLVLDYVLIRPIYFITSQFPKVFGYTAEDDAAFKRSMEKY